MAVLSWTALTAGSVCPRAGGAAASLEQHARQDQSDHSTAFSAS